MFIILFFILFLCMMTCFGYMLPPIMDAIKIQKELYRDAYLFDTTTHAMMKCIAEKDENKDENCSKFHLLDMPMRNRMEIIRLPGYIEDEKLNIAKNYLVPKNKEKNGLKSVDLKRA